MTTDTTTPKHPDIHALIYGMSGVGKSTFAAGFPKPMLVLAFDRYDNVKPYQRCGSEVCRVADYTGDHEKRKQSQAYYQSLGIAATDVRDDAGQLLVRIEHYYDNDPKRMSAYEKFNVRMSAFTARPESWRQWRTVVLDSLTFFQNAAVGWERTLNNPSKSAALKWYGEAKFHMEGLLYCQMGSADTNVLVLGHEATKENEFGSGGQQRGIAAVGQLSAQVPAGFGEVYHLVAEKGTDGAYHRRLRTDMHEDADGRLWFAKTQEGVRDGCDATYEALWTKD